MTEPEKTRWVRYAADYSIRAVVASGNGSAVESVRAWQAERRRHYGLEGR